MSQDTASGVLIDGYVYGFDLKDVQAKAHRPSRGEFRCMALATGEVQWATERTGHATVVAADGKLYLFNDRGEAILARASPRGYEELGRAAIFSGEICWTAPSLYRGRLYVRSPSKAACLYVGRPEDLDPQQRATARPAAEVPKSLGIDLPALVGGERPYMFDPPDLAELALWYGASLLALLGAAGLAALASGLLGRRWPGRARPIGRGVFWAAAFVLGIAGTPVLNRLQPAFVFTWPVCLFAAHQVALNLVVTGSRSAGAARRRWVALGATLVLVGVCLGYYAACRRLSMAIEWVFLMGFLPSWPAALPAAYRLRPDRPAWREALWAAAGFTLFYWAAGAIVLWRAATSG